MLRSKQLLPFAKGARAWIVAGSVSKPNPLDGTGNPVGSDDGKADQGYNGTKHSPSVKSPSYISRVEDSTFRRGAAAGAPASGAAKFERIHEGPNGAFIPGQSLAQRSVVNTVPTPSKDINSLPGNSKGPLLSADVGHQSVDHSQSANVNANANILAVGPGQAVKNSKGLVVKANSTGKKSAFITGKVGEVGLATISHISVQGSTSKHERISKVKALDAESNSVLPLPRAGKSSSACVENSVASDKAGPLKHSIGDNKVVESRSPLASGIPVHDTKPPPSVGCTTSVNNARKSVASVELKQGKPVSNHTITFGTVDAPVPISNQVKSVEAEAPLNKRSVLKSPIAAQHQVTRHAQTNPKGSSSEVTRGITNGDHGQNIVSQQGAGLSKDACAGISGGRGKTNGYSQAGVMRQSHWSARDTRGGTGSNDMVDQVGSILRRLGWTSQTVDALANFNSRLNAFHVNEVLKHQREPGLAWEFFNWAKRQSGYKHDVRTYTTMIGILGRVRNFEACDRLMQDMCREGCKPSVVTFNRLIHSYGRANYLGEALNLFHHMQEVGCEPDRVTYCTLIDLHSKAGFHDIAMDICQKMWQAGFESDTFSYTLIIHCLGKAGNLPAAYKLFLEMIDRGCTPNLVTYNIMIDLHAKAGKHHMALKLYNDMQDAGYRPDNVTYSVIMEVLGHSGHMDEAENVFIEMEQAGWTADATTFGSLVYMWGQTGNVKKATEWYKRMLDSGLLPNVPTCNSLLWAYMRVNDYEAARQVLEGMPKWGLSPTLPTYTLLLSNCTTCENQQHVDSTLLIMSRTGHPAHSFLCRLLNEIDSRESTTYVHQFFDSLHGEEQENKRSFADALIEFFYKLDRKDRAGNIWEVAVEKKLYPSAISQRAPNYWIVDLHVMSMGTAVVALLRTLASLREGMLTTGAVPDRIEIVTGWGKHSRVSGFSKIKNVVENLLGTLHAPFYVDTSNVGCFVGSGQPLVDWLHQSEMDHMLAL